MILMLMEDAESKSDPGLLVESAIISRIIA